MMLTFVYFQLIVFFSQNTEITAWQIHDQVVQYEIL